MTVKVSHLIPLYQSARFLSVVLENVRNLRGPDVEFVLADSNGDHETCNLLENELRDVQNVRVICDNQNLTWVENVARLIALAKGEYFQILPQDDSTSKVAIKAMQTALDTSVDAVLAYGRTRGIDLSGQALPLRDQLNSDEDPEATAWTLDDVLPMYWIGRFGGAFKALIRTKVAQQPDNALLSTPTTAHSERAWLFRLALAGRFVYVDEDVLFKRYYPQSTHQSWKRTPRLVSDATELMLKAVKEKIVCRVVREYAVQDLVSNSALRQHYLCHPNDYHCHYQPLVDPNGYRETSIKDITA